MTETRAAVVLDKREPMRVAGVRLRAVAAGEVRVRLAACGVCHSDLSALNEYFPCPTPVVLGHGQVDVAQFGAGMNSSISHSRLFL